MIAAYLTRLARSARVRAALRHVATWIAAVVVGAAILALLVAGASALGMSCGGAS